MASAPQRRRPRLPIRAVFGWLALLVTSTGCSSTAEPPPDAGERALARQYFRDNNAAARKGPRVQQEFLRRTQHPDFGGQTCELGATTVELDPAMSTLRPDPGFSLDGVSPRGRSWVVAVEVTVRRHGVVIGNQIGSQHIVFLNRRAHGFAPCPT
ncbi:hypothetical protein DFQ14_101370 [Halopolyspora algeriensis]|uniref:Lipoprotein n=1 Tax=Halopolyspora algeriensis TaxID=1500506 RepID=A0A368VXV0_9ACTN|nr:hypothetical protein [Halopolyspora algeriensis]RCW47026.1 hypothetical protein DFQ14_101370 [Halopolyspora algeriensis]TQM48113.1 hypothetical protein FHU43_3075 [Halopolyspora algeriensis]